MRWFVLTWVAAVLAVSYYFATKPVVSNPVNLPAVPNPMKLPAVSIPAKIPAGTVPYKLRVRPYFIKLKYPRQSYQVCLAAFDELGNYKQITLVHEYTQEDKFGRTTKRARTFSDLQRLGNIPKSTAPKGAPRIMIDDVGPLHLPLMNKDSPPYRILIRRPGGPWHLFKEVAYSTYPQNFRLGELEALPQLPPDEEKSVRYFTDYEGITPKTKSPKVKQIENKTPASG